jgi:bifunctional UDP-N-acetylglucosamine pyrophosphorylase/glucosamine-1-phosphate N-acetyltransferase
LTDIVEIAAREGELFQVIAHQAGHGWGINDRIQLAEHEHLVQDALRLQAMHNGVTMQEPATVFFSYDTQIGQDVTIEPNVYFGPGVDVGDSVHIKAFSHIEKAKIGRGSVIGPFARLRPGADLKENVKIGNFVEVKNAVLHEGVKANHLGYIGDAEIGAGTNFSCGAITVNYDGFSKHKTVIGKNVMVGSNVSLVAPVKIGDGALLAAGSTITENVPADALAIERGEVEIKEGWAATYRAQKQKT